ncbi:16606_t:CDS:2 [Acaulospora colombiana]|uniref:16606_t:CDS:1 n=1 Tax=Acaulospora colombiana TaxID=27376 RepID=A0ACA9LJR0_9GLOM|nr:16606_t:CDS:2 [Acaulospora colombiana]
MALENWYFIWTRYIYSFTDYDNIPQKKIITSADFNDNGNELGNYVT